MAGGVVGGVSEVWWWLRMLLRGAWSPVGMLLVAAVGLAAVLLGDASLLRWLLVPGAVLVAGLVWSRYWSGSWSRWVGGPVDRRSRAARVRREWPELMAGCGLGRPSPAGVDVPRLERLFWDPAGNLHAGVGLLVGQVVGDVDGASEQLRVAVGALGGRVVPSEDWTGCELVWRFDDHMRTPFARDCQEAPPSDVLDVWRVGRAEDGSPLDVPLRVSTLTGGSTGAGKGSVMWNLIAALAPASAVGLVELVGVDLKGGMELGLAPEVFGRYARTPAEAVAVLEDEAARCLVRAESLAGVARSHTPTVAAPLVVVVIDELAALVAYGTDKDLIRRGEQALSTLLTIGRAPGWFVYAFVQDPRKETIRMRHLFTQAIGLRLRERDEACMVLGDQAVKAGALCHQISRSTPGVGFVVGEDGRPVRFRAAHVSDEEIRDLAVRFPARDRRPIVIPADPEAARPGRTPRVRRLEVVTE